MSNAPLSLQGLVSALQQIQLSQTSLLSSIVGAVDALAADRGTAVTIGTEHLVLASAPPGVVLRSLESADLPLGTTTAPGALQPDGTSIVVNGGTISAKGGSSAGVSIVAGNGLLGGTVTNGGTISLEPATTAQLGGVIPDGSTILVGAGGRISAAPSGGGGGSGGTVTAVVAGTGLAVGTLTSGGTITSAGTINFAPIPSHDLLANTGGAPAAPTGVSLSALLDVAIANTQGDLLYRDAAAWQALAPGTAGRFLQTGGATANPAWADAVTKVVAGAGLSGGTISTTGTLAVTPATTAAIGGVIVGSGLAITGGGTLSATGGAAVTSVVAGTGLNVGAGPGGTITSTGTLNLAPATTSVLGGVIVGAGLTIASGTLSASGGVSGTGLFSPILSALPTSVNTGFSTWVNQGATAVFSNSLMGLTLQDQTSAGSDNWRILKKAAPATPYTATGLFLLSSFIGADVSAGFTWRDSATGKLEVLCFNQRGNGFTATVFAFTNPTSFSANVAIGTYFSGLYCWFRLKDDGTNVFFQASGDGVAFSTVYTVAKAGGFLGSSGYNEIGMALNPLNGGLALTLASYGETSP